MNELLTDAQRAARDEFRQYVSRHVEPHAAKWDRDQDIAETEIARLRGSGYLGAQLPAAHGGKGWDVVTFGLLNEAFGRGSPALTGVLTVQSMVSMALLKWGSKEHKARWLPRLASGETLAAFAMTEPGTGSDLQSITTEFTRTSAGESLVLNGHKKWISCAQFADLFLVFGKLDRRPAVCLVPRDTPGVEIEPIRELMGFRAAGLAEVRFKDAAVPSENLVGKPGFALSHIAPVGLHYGRISTACSALGLLRGCFEDSTAYAATRRVGNGTVGDFGMIRSILARMGTDLEAAGLLCLQLCRAEDDHTPEVFEKALMAKYFTSRAAVQAASDAIQVRGAAGVHGSSAVSRYYRDAKIMELIEGTTQVHEDLLGKMFVDQAGRAAR